MRPLLCLLAASLLHADGLFDKEYVMGWLSGAPGTCTQCEFWPVVPVEQAQTLVEKAYYCGVLDGDLTSKRPPLDKRVLAIKWHKAGCTGILEKLGVPIPKIKEPKS